VKWLCCLLSLHLCALSEDQKIFFEENGYLGPFSLLSQTEAEALGQEFASAPFKQLLHKLWASPHIVPIVYWSKNLLFHVLEAVALAKSEIVLSLLHSFLGPDLLLWGLELIEKRPGEHHRWHVDIEHTAWDGLTIWLALTHVSQESTLFFIPGSHKYDCIPQSFEKEIDLQDDQEMIHTARAMDPKGEIIAMDIKPGQFVLFAGRMWHRSVNRTNQTRQALIFQYCRPDANVRIPLNYKIPTRWAATRPWVLHIAGEDRSGVNHRIRQ